jgi:hypothetical protein
MSLKYIYSFDLDIDRQMQGQIFPEFRKVLNDIDGNKSGNIQVYDYIMEQIALLVEKLQEMIKKIFSFIKIEHIIYFDEENMKRVLQIYSDCLSKRYNEIFKKRYNRTSIF